MFTYVFGTFTKGATGVLGTLQPMNLITGPVGTRPFTLTGFNNFTGLTVGAGHSSSR